MMIANRVNHDPRSRGSLIGTVAEIPAPRARRFTPPRLHGAARFPRADTDLPSDNAPPALAVVELADVIALPQHVLLDGSGHTVLPFTFKKHRHHRHTGIRRIEEETYAVRQSYPAGQVRYLPGTSYYLDCEYLDIYGHNLLEVWPQVWGLDHLAEPVHRFVTSIELKPYVLQVLAHLGVPAERLVVLDGPARCERLLVPAPAVLARRYVHPVAHEVFGRIGELAKTSALVGTEQPRRLYLSRSRLDERPLVNELEVEAEAVRAGFTVIHPETLSLPDQLCLFSQATHLAGPGGSGMHNAVFAPEGCEVLILASSGWFVVIDILLSQGRYPLHYLFGDRVAPVEASIRSKEPWRVELDEVRAAFATVR